MTWTVSRQGGRSDDRKINTATTRDCRKFWGVIVNGVFPRLFFDREWTRGVGFEVGENRR